MKILFLDTSSKISEIALLENGNKIFHKILKESDGADQVVYNLRESFKENNLKPDEIDVLSLSNGPGSFTGLRIGSAVAKGICFVNGCKFTDIPTLDILANIIPSGKNITSLVPSNPKTSEFYFANYEKTNEGLIRISEFDFGFADDILKKDSQFIIKKESQHFLPETFIPKLFDYPNESLMESQFELTVKRISEDKFTDIENSTPIYIKQFIPKN